MAGKARGILHNLWRILTSMKTGLVLLILIGAGAAVGTLLPGYEKFYSSNWFQCLLALLGLNLLACIIKHFITIKKNHYRLGPLVTHIGFFLILTGSLLSSMLGDSSPVHVPVGQDFDTADVLKRGTSFTVALEDFTIERYEDGQPSEYISRVTIIDGENRYGPHDITVNNPLEYQGVKIHQAAFSTAVYVNFENSQDACSSLVPEGNFIDVPGTEYRLNIYRYIPHYDPAYGMETKSFSDVNPRIIYSVYLKGQFVGVGAAKPNEIIEIDEESYFHFSEPIYISGLQVKTDPGIPVVWSGCGVLLTGILLSFYLRVPRRGDNKMNSH